MNAPAIDPRRTPLAALIAASGAVLIGALLVIAIARHAAIGGPVNPGYKTVWLAIHLMTVIPALPLGAYIMIRRKGDRLHRMLGRIWAILMLVTAVASFGVQTSGHLSWIHLFSILVLVSVPRGVVAAMRGEIGKHRRIMLNTFIGMVVAGLFVFLPGRLFGFWLFGV